MGLMAVNVTRDGALSGDAALARHLATLPRGAPVIVMVHGYKYDPEVAGRCPHETLFATSAAACGRGVSWGEELGAFDAAAPPLCIGFGWPARGSAWRAWDMAARTALPLAGLLTRIAAKGHKAHLIAHSMGARVCLHAVAQAPAGSVGRVVLLSAAAHRAEARMALQSPAGRRATFVNVCSAENAVFDLLAEAITGLTDRSVGRGCPVDDPRWLDLRLDQQATVHGLDRLGFPVGHASARICHWSSYTRPGVFALYRALLSGRTLPLKQVSQAAASAKARPTILTAPIAVAP